MVSSSSDYPEILLHNNTTMTDGPPDFDGKFSQVWYVQMIYVISFTVLIIICVAGNSIVIWIITTNIKLRTATNVFIVNLSLSDILVALLNVSFNFVYMMNNNWPFGSLYCHVNNFVSTATLSISVFTLVAISIDRYYALVHVLRRKLSLHKAILIIIGVWMVSTAISIPTLTHSKVHEWKFRNGHVQHICYVDLDEKISIGYEIFIMVLTYFVPVIILAIVYGKIGKTLWWSQIIGERCERQVIYIKSKRKFVKMMIMVTMIFAVCYLPYQSYFLLQKIYPNLSTSPASQHIFLVLYWLAMSNSAYNPFVYCWLNKRFRQGFKRALRWLPGIGIDSTNPKSRLMTPRYSSFSRSHMDVDQLLQQRTSRLQSVYVANHGTNVPTSSNLLDPIKLNASENISPSSSVEMIYLNSISNFASKNPSSSTISQGTTPAAEALERANIPYTPTSKTFINRRNVQLVTDLVPNNMNRRNKLVVVRNGSSRIHEHLFL